MASSNKCWSLIGWGILLAIIIGGSATISYRLAKPGTPEVTGKVDKVDVHMVSSGNGSLVYTDVQVNLTSFFHHNIWLEYGVLNIYVKWGNWRVSKTISLPPPPPEQLRSQQQTWTVRLHGAAVPVGPVGITPPTDNSLVELVVKASIRYKMQIIFIKKKGSSTLYFNCPLHPAGFTCSVDY